MSSRHWNWLDNGVLPLSTSLMRVCWLWPWLASLQRWLAPSSHNPVLTPGLVFGLLLAGVTVSRGALRLAAPKARASVSLVGLAVVFGVLWWGLYRTEYSLFNVRWLGVWGHQMVTWTDWETRGVPPAVFSTLAVAYVWLQGVLDGGRLVLLREHIWHDFRLGMAALILLLLILAWDEHGFPGDSGNLLWLFFAVGMTGLALSSLRAPAGFASEATGDDTAEAPMHFDRYWLGSVASVIGALLGLAMVLSALVAPEPLSQLLTATWSVVKQGIVYLWIIISIALLPLAYLLSLVLRPVVERLLEFMGRTYPLRGAFDSRDELRPERLSQAGNSLLDRLPDEVRWLGLVVLVAAIGLAFALALRRLLSGSRPQYGVLETRETIVSRDMLADQLSRWLRGWLSRIVRKTQAPPSPFLDLRGEVYTRRVIRSVYQALLGAAQRRLNARLPAQTPNEYRATLGDNMPASRGALETITEGYVRARYGSDPPSLEQAQAVQRAWDTIQAPFDGREQVDGEE